MSTPVTAPDFPPGHIWSDDEERPVYKLYTARETADHLGVTERTVRRWIEAGRLQAAKEAGVFRIDIDAAREVFMSSRSGLSLDRGSLADRVAWLEEENERLWRIVEKAVT